MKGITIVVILGLIALAMILPASAAGQGGNTQMRLLPLAGGLEPSQRLRLLSRPALRYLVYIPGILKECTRVVHQMRLSASLLKELLLYDYGFSGYTR